MEKILDLEILSDPDCLLKCGIHLWTLLLINLREGGCKELFIYIFYF